jgi:predicted tellurium resistance membrane protein TerC
MNVMRVLGLAAVAALLMLTAPAERAQALSLASPGAAAAVQDDTREMTTEVHWRHRHHWHHRHWRHHHWHHRHWHHRRW